MPLAEKVRKLDLYCLHQNNYIESVYQRHKFHSDLFIMKVTKGQKVMWPAYRWKIGCLGIFKPLGQLKPIQNTNKAIWLKANLPG